MKPNCVHSCKGLCNALEIAEQRELQAIREYKMYASSCDYPDIREIMEALIADRERALKMLREKREILTVKFGMIDGINENYA
jgi:rubrerythrin